MIGISQATRDAVTFAITLPAGGLFKDYIEALREAEKEQATLGNVAAAQGLHAIALLAERGMIAYEIETHTLAPKL
jgi:hypothetical protein